jgi:alkylhydroperoxidase/carboxymuconolactone decarboxylase family protein YurZ
MMVAQPRDRSGHVIILLAMRTRAAQPAGASRPDGRGVVQHVAIHAGVPRAAHALEIARRTRAGLEALPSPDPQEETRP